MANVVLVDKNDRQIGLKEKISAHKIPVPLHRAVSILLFNKEKSKVLITRRALAKPTWPGFWSNTVCANLLPNESYKEAADRRLMEELGIKTKLTEEFSFIYKADMEGGVWGEHEIDHVFSGMFDGQIYPNLSEVQSYRWISIDILKKDIKKNSGKYTPWFKIILEKLTILK